MTQRLKICQANNQVTDWQIYITDPTPSSNEILRWPHKKWKHRKALISEITNNFWKQHLVGANNLGYSKEPICPAEVMVIRQYNNLPAKHKWVQGGLKRVMQLDSDNFPGGCKFVIDALRHARVIVDDDPSKTLLTFHQVKNENQTHCFTFIGVRSWNGVSTYNKEIKTILETYEREFK